MPAPHCLREGVLLGRRDRWSSRDACCPAEVGPRPLVAWGPPSWLPFHGAARRGVPHLPHGLRVRLFLRGTTGLGRVLVPRPSYALFFRKTSTHPLRGPRSCCVLIRPPGQNLCVFRRFCRAVWRSSATDQEPPTSWTPRWCTDGAFTASWSALHRVRLVDGVGADSGETGTCSPEGPMPLMFGLYSLGPVGS